MLSVTLKTFLRILLCGIKQSVNKILREEPAGFRKEKSCIEQIFVAITVMEQSSELKSPLYII